MSYWQCYHFVDFSYHENKKYDMVKEIKRHEVFQRQHGEEEEITVLNNEFYITGQDGQQKERIT